MSNHKNVVLTWIAGEAFCRLPSLRVFINSAKVMNNTDIIVFTHDMPEETQQWLGSIENIKIVHVPPQMIPMLVRDRFLVYWNWMLDHGGSYEYVLAVDSKDVIFQRSPFQWIDNWKARFNNIAGDKAFLNNFIIFTSEGIQFKDSEWNAISMFNFQRDVFPPFMINKPDEWVLNSGVILGTVEAMKNFCFLLWAVHMKSNAVCSEQAGLNYLYQYLKQDETYSVSHPQHDNLCLTGEGIKNGLFFSVKYRTEFRDDQFVLVNVRTNEAEPYYLVHQWDRFDTYKGVLTEKYGGND